MKLARRDSRRGPIGVLARVGFAVLLVACGSRTGLFGEATDDTFDLLPDGGRVPRDSGVIVDASIPEALPPIDAQPLDASRIDCPDAEATLIYVVTSTNELYSFYPPDGTFTFISNIACPTNQSATPFSMAVDRRGVAYVLFTDNLLYRVSTATGACVGTPFQANQQGFDSFGMGYATNAAGPTETLFAAGTGDNQGGGGPSQGLGRIDTPSFVLSKVGRFVPDIKRAELTGTGDGRLYAFYTKGAFNGPPSYIGEINTDTARVVAETPFPTVDQGAGWAFAFWGGDFYMFTSPQDFGSDVTRWRPSDNSLSNVASLPKKVVGAGVSTCAPSQ
ncbi:hypothetical protein BH11MYX4_BH11MYX4_64480 [soil metagenome]